MAPWIADPPWANKSVRLIGYALGGNYRGWLVPRCGADAMIGFQSAQPQGFYPATLFHSDGVDAVRASELQSAARCTRFHAKSKEPRQRIFRFYTAPRCEVLAPQDCVNRTDHWRDYGDDYDRPCGRWLRINEGSCDNGRIAEIIDDASPHYWLAVVDCWETH